MLFSSGSARLGTEPQPEDTPINETDRHPGRWRHGDGAGLAVRQDRGTGSPLVPVRVPRQRTGAAADQRPALAGHPDSRGHSRHRLRQGSHGRRRPDRGGRPELVSPLDPDCTLRPRPGRHPFPERGQGHRKRHIRPAQPDHRRDPRRAPGRGAQRSQPCRGDRPRLAGLGRRRRIVDGAQPGRPGEPQPRGFPGLHESRRGGSRAGRCLEEHPGHRRGHLRRSGLWRQRQGRLADARTRRDQPAGCGPRWASGHILRAGRSRRPDHDLLQPVRPEPFGRRTDWPRRGARDDPRRHGQCRRGCAHHAQRARLALKREIDMPITAELHQVLFEGKDPRSAVSDLMVRLPKVEWDL